VSATLLRSEPLVAGFAPDHGRKRETGPHLDYVDGLRAVAYLWVVAYHAIAISERILGYPYSSSSVGRLFVWLFGFDHYAVSVFIVISGFCLALPVAPAGGELRGGARRFYQKRARRILPPYYAALALSVVITVLRGQSVTAGSLISHLLLIHDIGASWIFDINGAFWSIAVEWQIYFLFPLLLVLWIRIGPGRATVITMASSLAVLYLLLARHHYLKYACPQFVGFFAVGALAAGIAFGQDSYWMRLRNRVDWRRVVAAFAAPTVVVCLWKGPWHHPGWLIDPLVALLAASLLALGSIEPLGSLRKLLRIRSLPWIGTFSYSIYLIHAPLFLGICCLALMPLQVGVAARVALFWLVGLPLSLAATYAFHLAFERPFMNTRR
jgi:peptidoglycan/LPS O-acetylase OafA/YrhL